MFLIWWEICYKSQLTFIYISLLATLNKINPSIQLPYKVVLFIKNKEACARDVLAVLARPLDHRT
jgi:hypothetical protein